MINRKIILGFVLVWMVALSWGCGGSQQAAEAPQAGATPVDSTAKAADTSKPAEPTNPAREKFSTLSKSLDDLAAGNPVDQSALEKSLKEVLSIDPKFSPARFNLGVLKEIAGDRDGAKKIYEDILDDDADFAPAAENVAAFYVDAGEASRAQAVYERIVAKDPLNQTSRLALARLLLQQKQYQQAIELCRQVLQRQADAIEAFRVLAHAYQQIGNIPMSELIIGRGLKLSKDDVELHFLAAQIMLNRGDLTAGVDKLKQLVRIDPKNLKVRAQLGSIALSYRDYGNAAQQYEVISKEQPTNMNAQIALAVAYKGLGRFEQSEKIYQQVLQKDPNSLDSMWNLGVLYHRHLGKYDEASAMYRKFKAQANPGDSQVAQVDTMVKDIERVKNDMAANKARQEKEQKKKEALASVCADVAAGKKPKAEAIGDDQERIETAWQLMVAAQTAVQSGDAAGGEVQTACAFAVVPEKSKEGGQACGQMRVMWAQILYQLNRLDDALTTIRAGIKCDPANPDAQVIEQQLVELIAQQKTDGAPAPSPQ